MKIILDSHSGVPIYIQLKEKIKLAIATGEYQPEERLPTVRQLAVDLKINPNTVSRIYSAMEQEGILATRQGRGTFVRDNIDVCEEKVRGENLERIIENFLCEIHQLGYEIEHVQKKILELSQRTNKCN